MRNAIQFVGIIVVAVVVACLYLWWQWSSATRPPDPLPGGIVVPRPAPAPLVAVEPGFSHFSTSLYNENRRLRWGAVYTLGELADAAYADAHEQIRRAKLVGAVEVTPLSNRNSEGFVASDATTVVVSFRGTQEARDFVTDILGFPRFMEGGSVHHGFNRAIDAIYSDAVKAAISHGAADKTLFVTGHSLGGAIACGFSMRASRSKHLHPSGVVTFGQPLVMSESLCQYLLEEYGDQYVRIVNGVDPITTLVRTYRHAGARARLRDDGEYDWRTPLVAPTAPPPGTVDVPQGTPIVEEDIPELQPITEAEARELQRKINEADSQPPSYSSAPGAVGSFFTNPIADHGMAGYLTRLREVARRRPAASGPRQGQDDLRRGLPGLRDRRERHDQTGTKSRMLLETPSQAAQATNDVC